MAYEPSAWSGFAGALAGVAGSLTGLLFVAVSVQSSALRNSQHLLSRAAQSLVLFMSAVLTALLIAVPQHRVVLGIELLALAVPTGVVLFVLGRRAGKAAAGGALRKLERYSPNSVTTVLIVTGGVTLLLKAGGGLYWVLAAAIASLLGGVITSWLFLIKL